ncbi:MAG TPA: tyrosine-type recombinase/integrase [Candidatus Bathyarchaeia archaeon]|nr:tyrosine-type recombinase/integrase [Candidatus Bathyarchaeia archaeon]
MSAQEFLDYIAKSKAKNTNKSYRNAVRKFAEWYKGTYSVEQLNEILQERKDSMQGKGPQEKRRFERLVEEWHRTQLNSGASINSARNRYVAVTQFFKFFDLDLNTAVIPSEVKKTMISEKDYPLTVEDLRAMHKVADLRGRTILLMAKDLGQRLSDFKMIKVEQLPNLDSEPPIPFSIETGKEHVQTKGFLSAETVQALKTYLETLRKRKKPSPFLWPSNGKHPLDEDSFGVWLKNLAEKAGIKTGNQKLTFHCFRRLLMRAAIETGVGLTAAKLMVGKAVEKSDETYIAKARLDKVFTKLSKYLNVTGTVEERKPLQDLIVQQEKEISSLRKRIEAIVEQIKEYEETFDSVVREFATLILVLAERLGDETTLRMLHEAKERLDQKLVEKVQE